MDFFIINKLAKAIWLTQSIIFALNYLTHYLYYLLKSLFISQ